MANSHEKTADKAKKRRRRIRQIRGMLFTLFAVIGIVTVVTGGVRILRERLNPADDLEEYTALISPLVVLNPRSGQSCFRKIRRNSPGTSMSS